MFRSYCSGAMAHNAGIFFSYGTAKRIVSSDGTGNDLTLPQYYMAGSLASLMISVVESPVDLFKCKLQAQVHISSLFSLLLRGLMFTLVYRLRTTQLGEPLRFDITIN